MSSKHPRRRLALALPLAGALGVFALLGRSLQAGGKQPAPSALLNQPAPSLQAARLDGPAFDSRSLAGKVWVLNVWASWCAPCRAELPALAPLQAEVPLLGLNYKDAAPAAERFLAQHGNPYALNLLDPQGQLAIDWGVVAVPETFVIDARGRVRFKHSGPLSAEQVQRELLPLIRKLRHG